MNFHVLNGATLNGSRVGAILAAAAILCSASASAVGTRQQDALAPTSSSCQVSASAIRIAGAAASVLTEAQFAASTQFTQAAFAAAGGSANAQAFVLREALGFSMVACTANITAIPASVLGSATWSGGALVTADATKAHPGASIAAAGCEIGIYGSTVTRFVLATGLSCAASVRAEPAINGTSYSYSDVYASGSVAVDVVGLVSRAVSADIAGTMSAVASASHIKPASSSVQASGAVFSASPHTQSDVMAFVTAACGVTAAPDRVLDSRAVAQGTAAATAIARQRHGSASSAVQCASSVLASGLVSRFGRAAGSGAAQVVADALRTALPMADINVSVDFGADPSRTTDCLSNIVCSSLVDDVEAAAIRNCDVLIAGSASVLPLASRVVLPAVAIGGATGDAGIAVEALATRMVESFGAHCSADVLALADRKAMVGALVDLSCDLDAAPLRTTAGQADVSMDHAPMEAEATAIMFGESAIAAGVTIEPVPRVIPPSFAEVVCSSDVAASARVLPPSFATVDCSSDVAALALRVRTAEAAVDCGVTIAPAPLRIAMVEASIDGAAEIFADTVSNPDSIDPPERTFVRTPVEAAFIRPEQETYFRRAA